MEKKTKRRLILIISTVSMILGMFFSVILCNGYVDSTTINDAVVSGSTGLRSATVGDSLNTVSLELRVTEATYNGEPKEYELKGPNKDLGGFNIEYYYLGSWHSEGPTDVKSRNHGDLAYKVRITREADSTYQAYNSGEFEGLVINPKVVFLKVNDYTISYGDDMPTVSAIVVDSRDSTTSALVGDDNMMDDIYNNIAPTFLCSYNKTTNGSVGEYAISFEHEQYSSALNYTVQDYINGTLSVNKKTINFTVESYSGVYDGHPHSLDINVTNVTDAEIIYSVDGVNYILPSYDYTNATNGSLTVYFKITKPNYEDAFGSGTINITKKDIVVNIENVSMVEGGTKKSMIWNLVDKNALAYGDTKEDLKITLFKSEPENYTKGRYIIYGSYLNGNYNVSWQNGTYTITATNIYNSENTSVQLDCAQGLDPEYTLAVLNKFEDVKTIDFTKLTGENTEVILAYDISVLDKDSNEVDVTGRSELKIKLKLTEEQKEIKNFQIVYIADDGTMEKVDSDVKVVGDYLVFKVEHLSTYAVVGDKIPNYLLNIIGIMLVGDVLLLLCYILLRNKNKHIFYSFVPLLSATYVPFESTIAVIVLGVVTVVLTVLIFKEIVKDADVRNKYDYSFTAKILLCKKDSVINKYYSKLRNKLYSYKNMSSVVTWKGEQFFLGEIEIAKITIDRTYLDLYVAIEHGFFKHTSYNIKNASNTLPGKTTPSKLNIDNDEDYLDACEVIDMVAQKYGLTPARKFSNVDYSTRKVSLMTLIHRGLVITDKILDENSLEAREIKNVYKVRYSKKKNVKHITMTNNDNSLSMTMCEVTEDYKDFVKDLKECTGKSITNYTKIKNMLLHYETITDRIEGHREILYLGHVEVSVIVSQKHIFISFIGDRDELLRALPEEKIDDTGLSISFDLNYEDNVKELSTIITRFASAYNLLKMTDYKQKTFKSLILESSV